MKNSDESKSEFLDQAALRNARRPTGVSGKIKRATQILQHYQLSKIARRGTRVLQRRLQPGKCVGQLESSSPRLNQSKLVTELAIQIVGHHADHPSHTQCDIDQGKFVLLNHLVEAKNCRPSADVLRGQTHLWRFQFHYQEFLLTQAAKGNWQQISSFLNSWMDDYDPETTKQSDDSWHPYCISRRAVAWVWLLVHSSHHGNGLGQELRSRLTESLQHQSQYLSNNLEWDLGGNHLIENATALAIVGGVLDSEFASQWRKTAHDVLVKELPKQILTHGEHFEYSPMYHCQILSNLLRIEICCENDGDLKSVVDPLIDPMLDFLSGVLHPDGEIPLFGDSVYSEAPSVQQITDVANLVGREFGKTASSVDRARQGCYFVSESEKTFAICDFGPIAAPNLPAHGHCDVFNLEVSVGENRWIVDSGNFNYSDDSMRHYCRSSIGHNVVTIDDENQANVWSMFRMGNRPKVDGFRTGIDQGWNWASASHDGYEAHGVKELTRVVATNSGCLVCADIVNSLQNSTSKNFVGYLHFHPDVEVGELIQSGDSQFRLEVTSHGDNRSLEFFADLATIEKGWYCEEFGKRRAASVVRYVTPASSRFTAWILQESSNQCEIEFRDQVMGITMGNSEKFCWKPSG